MKGSNDFFFFVFIDHLDEHYTEKWLHKQKWNEAWIYPLVLIIGGQTQEKIFSSSYFDFLSTLM